MLTAAKKLLRLHSFLLREELVTLYFLQRCKKGKAAKFSASAHNMFACLSSDNGQQKNVPTYDFNTVKF
jgi:hypothetical protein